MPTSFATADSRDTSNATSTASSANTSSTSSHTQLFSLALDFPMSTSHLPGNAAPLPSPTTRAMDTSNYFGSLPQSQPQNQDQRQSQHPLFQQQQARHQQQQAQQPQQATQQHREQYSQSSNVQEPVRQNSSSSSGSETSLHLMNATLLAEAAGRAQVDCTTRDIEEMQL